MRYNFSDRVRIVFATAREEAIRLRHDYVAPAHLALGLLREVPERYVPAGVDLARVRAALADILEGPGGKNRSVPGELPYTSTAKKALEGAMSEGRARKDSTLDTDHLLAGIVAADQRVAAVLSRFGIARAAVSESAAGSSSADEPDEGRTAVWFLQVDPMVDTPLYEQIIERVEEAVATGKLTEGERLPPVRQLAAELEIAPGTVARAYQALEENGVVVAEGARGTRVASVGAEDGPDDERAATLEGLFRSAVVAAYHMGAKAKDVRGALERAMRGIYGLLV